MNNELAYKRCNVDEEGKVSTESGDIRLRLINISAAGAEVSVPKMLSVNKSYRFKLAFHVNIFELQFQTDAKVVRQEGNDGKDYIYDIRFLNLKDNLRIEIDEAINHNFALEGESKLIS